MSDDSRKRLRALCEGNRGYVEVSVDELRELLDETDEVPPDREVEVEDTDTMIRLGGSTRSFRCNCGANVFRRLRLKPDCFKCNGCGDIYEGEE